MHAINITIESRGDSVFILIKAIGKLTHEDYLTFEPLLDSAINDLNHPKVKILFDATEFDGWELRAAWDDFKLGLKYGEAIDKVALLGSLSWQKWAAVISSWFISGEVRSFHKYEEAINWLLS